MTLEEGNKIAISEAKKVFGFLSEIQFSKLEKFLVQTRFDAYLQGRKGNNLKNRFTAKMKIMSRSV